jgi:hypothetical protein
MSVHTFDQWGEPTLPNDPDAHWQVVWVRTSTGWHAHVGEKREDGWNTPHLLVFEGFAFMPRDALLAFEAMRRQVPKPT